MEITKEQHIKKHTLKENTYNEDCPFCNEHEVNPMLRFK